MKLRQYIAVSRFNGCHMAVAEVTPETVTVQGWVHRETMSRASFAERYKIKRIRATKTNA